MTTFLLIRHGAHALGGDRIAGRAPGVRLSELGVQQVSCLAERLNRLSVKALYTSPLERTRGTAQILGGRLGLQVEVMEELQEIDYGDWSGRTLDELRELEQFGHWNRFRSGTRIPEGEIMLAVQLRVVAAMLRIKESYPNDCVALVSHGDVIKAALTYFLGVPLDLLSRIEIGLGSVSAVALADGGPWILHVNSLGDDLAIPENDAITAERSGRADVSSLHQLR